MPISCGNIHVVKELFTHKPHVTLDGIGFHRIVFVKVIRNHILETQSFLTVHSDEF